MQIVENWAEIHGTIVRCEESERSPEFTIAYVNVKEVRDVPGFKNLIRQHADRPLPVHVPTKLGTKLGLNRATTITCWIRMAAPNKFFVHRQHLTVGVSDD